MADAQVAQTGPGGFFVSGAQEQAYIIREAESLGLDPRAVLAVAKAEGITLPAQVGDKGTSFGPWQMHTGGALPESVWQQGPRYAQQWANSPAGINYALRGIRAAVGQSTQGTAEIAAQVYGWEQPSDPAGEFQRASGYYQAGAGPELVSGLPPVTGTGTAAGGGAATGGSTGGGGGGVTSSFVGVVTRVFFILAGSVLLFIALVQIARTSAATTTAQRIVVTTSQSTGIR